MSPAPADGRRYVVVGVGWLLIAVGLGASGQVATWRPPVPQFVLVGLTTLVLAAFVARPRFRGWLGTLDLGWLVALHLTRFVGIYFLVLYYRDGTLPYAFAVPGGWATSSSRHWRSRFSRQPARCTRGADWSVPGTFSA